MCKGIRINFFEELKRRRIFRVGLTYIVAAWLLLQVADLVLGPLGAPEWVLTALIVVLGLGLPFALALSWAYQRTPDGIVRDTGADSISVDSVEQPSRAVAVLPFVDISEDQRNEHFTDGLTEELLNALTNIRDMRVASRTSCFAFKGSEVDLKKIAATLNVSHLIVGSVRKAEDRLRVNVQLVDASSDTQLWSETYDRVLDDIFEIQSDISVQIRNALQITLRSKESPDATTENSRAYDYYLSGLGFIYIKGSVDIYHAIKMFRHAVEQDPNFLKAWTKLANCLAESAIYHAQKQHIEEAQQAAANAIRIAPERADSYTAMGAALLADGQYPEAMEQFKKAIALDSDNLDAHTYAARAAFHTGDHEVALRMFTRAAECDPSDWESVLLSIALRRELGDGPATRTIAKSGIERVERYLELYPNNQRAYYLGAAAWLELGDKQKALEWIETALRIAPNDEATRYNAACHFALTGDLDRAFECLENSMSSRSWIENDPDMKPLREDPRYEAFISTLA